MKGVRGVANGDGALRWQSVGSDETVGRRHLDDRAVVVPVPGTVVAAGVVVTAHPEHGERERSARAERGGVGQVVGAGLQVLGDLHRLGDGRQLGMRIAGAE